MKTIELAIEGMTCGHCVMTVKKRLAALPGVTVHDVAIGRALVTIADSDPGEQALVDAVNDAGYTVVALNERAGA